MQPAKNLQSLPTDKPVTQEDFVKNVSQNYSIAIDNQNKLTALQDVIKNQIQIIEK